MPPQINKSQYSVVVVGAMNPAIHHPNWYHLSEMLTAAETEQAIRSSALVIMPQLARFNVSELEIQCTPGRWQVTTTNEEERNRLIELAATTFHRLGETPVTSYGVNSRFDIVSGLKNVQETVGNALADIVPALSFNNLTPKFDSLSVSYPLPSLELGGQPIVKRQLKATIAQSPQAPDEVVVSLNIDHKITIPSEPSRFDLDVLLRASVDVQETPDSFVQHLITTLPRMGG